MPWPPKVPLLFFLWVLCVTTSTAGAQDYTVQVGTPVNLVASSNVGAPNYNGTPCGPDNSYTCSGGTVQPNGNIQWTVDGAPASSSYDTVKSSGAYCSADGNVNYYTYCYSYWDESGYTAVLPVGSHTITASISTAQDQYAAFTKTWTVLVTGSAVSNPQVRIYNFSAKDSSGNSGYALNGNLLNYSDMVTGSWTMSYDAVNRLHTGVTASGPYSGASITWNYDSFGNRLRQNVTGNPNVPTTWATYGVNNQLLKNQLAPYSNTLGYDASGNMTFDGNNNVIYDGEGRICAVAAYNAATQSILVTQYLYDAEGNRVAKGHPIGNSTTPSCPTGPGDFQPDEKYILGQNGEQVTQLDGSDSWQHTNVWVGSQLLATYDNQPITVNGQTVAQPLHFNVTDPLGTKRLQVSAAGVTELNCLTLPFGDGPDCSGTEATRHRFTGKERDTESGLDYFGARYYGSTMGRWMSPDWASKPEAVPYSSLDNPQSLNLYGYVLNNPLSKADPDGHAGCPPDCGDPTSATAVAPSLWSRFVDANVSFLHSASVFSSDLMNPTKNCPTCSIGIVPLGIPEEAAGILQNAAQGKVFQEAVAAEKAVTDTNVVQNVTIKTESGVKTVMDVVSKDASGNVALTEAKSSATARLTPNQTVAHPEIAQTGGTVVGQGKPGFPGGTKIPPTEVKVVRPNQPQ